MPKYRYYLVKDTYVVRWEGDKTPEFVRPDGTWHPYRDEWDVMTNGRYSGEDAEKAMEIAQELFDEAEEDGFEYP